VTDSEKIDRLARDLETTVRRLQRIALATACDDVDEYGDAETILAAVRRWMSEPEIDWLEPPADVADVLDSAPASGPDSVSTRAALDVALADRHRFRAALRHAQTHGNVVLGAISKLMRGVGEALDDERGLPRGFDHEPQGEAMCSILGKSD